MTHIILRKTFECLSPGTRLELLHEGKEFTEVRIIGTPSPEFLLNLTKRNIDPDGFHVPNEFFTS